MSLAALIKESRENREAWHYTKLDAFEGWSLEVCGLGGEVQLPEAVTRHRLVFVDGIFRRELSALDHLPAGFLSPCDVGPNCCAITLSNQICLAIDPVEMLFVATPKATPCENETTIKVSLGANSRLTLIERHVDEGEQPQARHVTMNIDLAVQSKLTHGKIVRGDAHSLHFAKTKVRVEAGAFYDHFGLIAGGRLTRCEAEVALCGKMAEARLLGVMLLRGAEHGDLTSLVAHKSPHTNSRQICKSVLADKARGVFQGKVLVDKGAQKTDGYQLCRALLLSDKAEMNAKPELEIYADDVKCSHGTAVGDLDENALFYLLSRGIPANEARAMLVEAFVKEQTDLIPEGDLKNALQKEVEAWLAL